MTLDSATTPSLWHRLKQRKLFQWLLAYCACAWVGTQLLGLIGDSFEWPRVVMQSVWVVAGVGVVAAAVISWYHGERGYQRVSAPEIVMLIALVTTAGGVLYLVGSSRPGVTAVPAPSLKAAEDTSSDFVASVAVLPFQTYASDAKHAYLGDAVAEEITAQLGQVSSLKVISRTSVARFRNPELDMAAIADTLGVRHVVEGSVVAQAEGGEMKITVQLIDAPRDVHVNSNTWIVKQADLFSAQEKIAAWVLESVLSRVHELRAANPGSRTSDVTAYEAFFRGRDQATARKQADLQSAIAHLENAIKLDPKYAPPYAVLATVYGIWGTYGYPGDPDSYAGYARALRYANKAIELDPDLAEAYAARGYLLSKSWAPASMIQPDFDRALKLRPSSADVRAYYAHFLTRENRFKEAVEAAERAIELDPLAPGRDVGLAYDALSARQYSLAVRAAEHAQEHEPTLKLPEAIRAMAAVLSGRSANCDLLKLDVYPGIAAVCLHAIGKTADAAGLIEAARKRPLTPTLAQQLAIYSAWTGDANATLSWLAQSYQHSPNGLDFRAIDSGLFDRVLKQPGFARSLQELRQDIWSRVQTATQQ